MRRTSSGRGQNFGNFAVARFSERKELFKRSSGDLKHLQGIKGDLLRIIVKPLFKAMRNGASWAVFPQVCWLFTVLLQTSCQLGFSAVPPESSLDGTACHQNDTCTLLEFKAKLENGGEPMLQSWNNANLSSWRGVKWIRVASEEFRVQGLNLSGLELNGTDIAPLLHAGLTNLVSLDISNNYFNTRIPDPLGIYPSLSVLDLHNNSFFGSLPQNWGGFGQLTSLLLGGNHLSGVVPDGIGNLTNLVNLDLTNNSFNERIPTFLGNLTKLTSLRLGSNNFSGTIPFDDLGNLRNLTMLDVTQNSCSGTIRIPANGGGFSGLKYFSLANNHLSGHIPEVLGNLSNLITLDFQSNNLTGEIPSSLSRLSKLQLLRLSQNKLNGTIPAELSQLTNLVTFSVNDNQLIGSLPHLRNCLQLKSLWIGVNNFNGSIPAELGSLPALVVLSLYGNKFNGTIPVELTQLQNLTVFDVSWNSLTGHIPEELCHLSQLLVLLLNNNGLGGSIPRCFGNFLYVRILDLSYNSLSGGLPGDVSKLSKLAPNISEAAPELTSASYIQDVSGQNLVYQFQRSPVSWFFVQNQLSGPIPTGFGNNTKLQQLLLQNNSLSGPIPDSLGDDTALYSLDLSFNHLSGSIPRSLTKLSFLSKLNLSFNNLSGPIPEEQQFLSFSASSFKGNPFLCGIALNISCDKNVPPGDSHAPKSAHGGGPFRKLLPLYIILASAVVCFCFLGCLFIWSWIGGCSRRCTSLVSNDGDAFDSKDDLRVFHFTMSGALHRFDRRELASGTDNFNENNIVGDGGFGLVYKARLNNGSVVAVKKLTETGIQGQAEFLAETRTLGKIKKHRNLVSLLGYCAYDNERLLVYEYMENGSLDTWLHCREEGMASLEWGTRLKVARGAAEGLAFLHHDMNPSIIHRDIKASNILLGCDFEAHLADFGLARSAELYESHVSTDVAGTAGYIPPEYSQTSAATTKGDVYSFGVVLLEILTGRRPMDPFFKNKDMSHVVNWIFNIDWSTEDAVTKTLDVTSAATPDEMLELMRIACMCCQRVPSKRPTMQQIVRMLQALEKHQGSSRSPSVVLYDESMSSPRCR